MNLKRFLFSLVLIVTLLVPASLINTRPAAAAACDAAEFVSDVTIPDGTTVAPGAAMVKTWRIRNTGTCTWSTAYAIVFYAGTQMGAPSVVHLATSVAPGATVDVTVNMTAPTVPGHYRSYWMMRNASNVLFGMGPHNYTFFIDIVVSATYTAAYDFVANYCSATWKSGAGTLPCPGTDGNASGFVIKSAAPQLEDGTLDSTPGLIVAPQNITDGFISGTYPAIPVQSGDRFQTIVSCAYNVTSCYVTFRLDYQIGSGPVYTFWSFRERTEGSYYRANIDLSSLAGQNVNFILKVMASGSPAGDRVLWGGARLVRAGGGIIIPPASTCDRATLVADVTIPDGTEMSGGSAFVKTWRLQNAGTCTWTTSYKLVFVGGDHMNTSATIFNLPNSVAPGASIDLSVNLAAPITPGNFIGYWKLQNASGVNFGVGTSGVDAITVNINVTSAYASVYNFVTSACSASWSSGAGSLPCPSSDGDARGFVLTLGSHLMEDAITSNEGLLTFPQNVTDGYIKGIYPEFAVQSGDHFQSYVGCQSGGPANCYVTFRLDYQIGSGPVVTLKTARERLENMVYRMDVDLSSLAGQNVKFILMVQAFGSPSGDRAVWSAPRIVRNTTTTMYTLSVTKAGTGSGTVTSVPPGINCGSDCAEAYSTSTSVTLSAAAATGSSFTGWSGGGCTGAGTCTVTMDGAKAVTATFALGPTTYALSITKAGTGSGTVTSSPPGITCGSDCSEAFAPATVVTLTAAASTGSTFTGWSSVGCPGTGTCNVTMDAAKSITATFTLNTYTLTVALSGTGSGTVTSSPAGINCGTDCSEAYNYNTVVVLTATAASGSAFSGWTGAGCSGTGTCTVTMDAVRAVTAAFAPGPIAWLDPQQAFPRPRYAHQPIGLF